MIDYLKTLNAGVRKVPPPALKWWR